MNDIQYCPNCGKRIGEDGAARFCKYCGSSLTTDASEELGSAQPSLPETDESVNPPLSQSAMPSLNKADVPKSRIPSLNYSERHRRNRRAFLIGSSVFLSLLAIVLLTTPRTDDYQPEEPPSAASTENQAQPSQPQPTIDLPRKQVAFINAIRVAKAQYDAAPNELRKSEVRTWRGSLIRSALGGSRTVYQWIGKAYGMTTNSEGQASLDVSLLGSDRIELETSSLFHDPNETVINQGTILYSEIADLDSGDVVVFSGTFLPSEREDYVWEGSETELGSMEYPEFLFKFIAIKKY